jgi:hypothetical protein
LGKKDSLEYLAKLPNPVQLITRTNPKLIEKALKFPISPSFVNNYNLAKDENIKPIVEYCRQ